MPLVPHRFLLRMTHPCRFNEDMPLEGDRLLDLEVSALSDADKTLALIGREIRPLVPGLTMAGPAFTVVADGDLLPVLTGIGEAHQAHLLLVGIVELERVLHRGRERARQRLALGRVEERVLRRAQRTVGIEDGLELRAGISHGRSVCGARSYVRSPGAVKPGRAIRITERLRETSELGEPCRGLGTLRSA